MTDIMDCDYEDDAGNCSSPHGCYCAEIAAAVLRDEKAAALIASQAARIRELEAREWHDGPPPHPWTTEWFIAETTDGERLVLRALPEEWTFDFTTAEQTYFKASLIKRWMRFPDSHFIEPDARSLLSRKGGE